MSEITKRESSDIKDNTKAYIVFSNENGMPYCCFITDESVNDEEALNMFVYYGIKQAKKHADDFKKAFDVENVDSHFLKNSSVKEVPMEYIEDIVEKFGMEITEVPYISKVDAKSKEEYDDPEDWKKDAIDVEYKEIKEPKEISNEEIDEVLKNAGVNQENQDIKYVKEKFTKLGIRYNDKIFNSISSYKNKDIIKTQLLGYLIGTIETLKYENDNLKDMLKEKRGY